ncbi:MAG TPA: hypothetical protein P5120_10510 [Spirochaetota bacterium]|mgnify:CR=1 FL=1|nr:hypothetical protein [Spirochaetota bacterium]HPF04794.1 hypothetical protein [Spirochaetota bacterium]HPJ41089.1 hypothetical protein [Spirochaetota bacterium]HPR37985.1 hypothetical protein [Spirochaetota bacterium]HRX47938.1 hypothetical protein [Spirochaetota bacterium]
MSFIILLLIIFLIYACLAKYGTVLKVSVMISIIFAMTAAFFAYGIYMFRSTDVFSIAGTDINLVSFIHVCVVWTGADIICAFRIMKNYRYYLEVNGKADSVISAEQAQG